jgi:hypothetical protein
MRTLRSTWWLAALALTACSLLLDFGPEGQPCDSRNQCTPGYACRDGGCVESPGSDGGTGRTSLCEDPDGCPEQAAEPTPESR